MSGIGACMMVLRSGMPSPFGGLPVVGLVGGPFWTGAQPFILTLPEALTDGIIGLAFLAKFGRKS